jgi:dTDP-4-amino-4,6-dideoxygalactose transaminase
MNIKFLPLALINSDFFNDFIRSLPYQFENGDYINGPVLASFENQFAKFCVSKYAVGVGNGLEAIKLLLLAHDIGPGDEVIVPANTFIATWLAISQIGAIPIPIDSATNSQNLDPLLLPNLISKKTRAIIAVHLYGDPCDMDQINLIAKDENIYVFEDAAQAHGAFYKNRIAGSLADGAAFSIYPGKNLGGIGDGGAITLNDTSIHEKLISLRNYGSTEKYIHKFKGFNSRLDEIQAFFLKFKLSNLKNDNQKRVTVAEFYLKNIKNPLIKLPEVNPSTVSAWHLFVVRTRERDKLRSFLELHGIETLIHYPIPPHLQEAYTLEGFKNGDFPNAEEHCKTCLSLPIHQMLGLDEINYIVKVVNSYC